MTPKEILEGITGHTQFDVISIPKNWIYQAMEEYAEHEAKAFRVWCNNQVIAGRTDAKLFEDYQNEK